VRIGKTEGRRTVYGLVDRAMLDRPGAIAVQRGGGKSAFVHDVQKMKGWIEG
jgi:hypothetical protein